MAEREQPWVQVIGAIAIHSAPGDEVRPSGSTRVLLAMLVAAGPDGLTLEEMARSYWNGNRPESWRIALRASIGLLQARLPDEWAIATANGHARLVPGTGFVDAWRVEAEAPHQQRPEWLRDGRPYPDVTSIPVVDASIERTDQLLPERSTEPTIAASLIDELQVTQRVILLASSTLCRQVLQATRQDDEVDINVVGDRGLMLPLGPYVVAFPELRRSVQISQGVIEPDAVRSAWQVVANAIAIATAVKRQRLHIANAHELDASSLALTSLLVERGPISGSSIMICADDTYRDVRWLDFVRRATTAGCRLVELN